MLGGHNIQADQTWLSLKAQIWKLDLAKSNFQNFTEKNKTLARCALCEQSTKV